MRADAGRRAGAAVRAAAMAKPLPAMVEVAVTPGPGGQAAGVRVARPPRDKVALTFIRLLYR